MKIGKETYLTIKSPSQFARTICRENVDCYEDENFNLTMHYYVSSKDEGQASGAYIFRPMNNVRDSTLYDKILSTKTYQGGVVNIIHLEAKTYEQFITSFVANDDNDYLEVETELREIPIDDGKGKEIIFNLETEVKNGKTFYTDSNGLEL